MKVPGLVVVGDEDGGAVGVGTRIFRVHRLGHDTAVAAIADASARVRSRRMKALACAS